MKNYLLSFKAPWVAPPCSSGVATEVVTAAVNRVTRRVASADRTNVLVPERISSGAAFRALPRRLTRG